MVMDTIQIRLSKGLIKQIDNIVKKGMYSSRSELIRDSTRRLATSDMVGIIPDTGDSVKEIRKLRKKLSKEKFDLDEINSYATSARLRVGKQ